MSEIWNWNYCQSKVTEWPSRLAIVEQPRGKAWHSQAAENMKSRADEIERNGHEAARQQADKLRAQADRTREQGQARADEVRNEEHSVAGTSNHNGPPREARGGGPSVQAALRSYAEA